LDDAGIPRLDYLPENPDRFVSQVRDAGIEFDYLISACFGFILPPTVLSLPRIAGLNTHPSYLPFNRGRYPNVWAIVDRTPAGGSVHYLEPGIDSGPLLVRHEVRVRPDDTGESLYHRCVQATEQAFHEAWDRVCSGQTAGTPQAELGPGTDHKGRDLKRLDRLDLDQKVRAGDLINWLRARTFPPHPGVRFESDGKEYQVRLEIAEVSSGSEEQRATDGGCRTRETPEKKRHAGETVPAAAGVTGEPFYRQVRPVNDPGKIEAMATDPATARLGVEFIRKVTPYDYSYNFSWLGRPVIQFPQDLIALQEIVWSVQPDLVIETGVAHGGSLIFHASLLELLQGDGEVLGVDIEIRPHNRAAIEAHPLFSRISLLEGSSVAPKTLERVRATAAGRKRVLVILDSNHSHEHVLRELQLYSPLVTRGSYLVVLDTIIEDLFDGPAPDRPWGKGNNPYTAVREFLDTDDRFVLDDFIQKKLLITVGAGGYLRCVRD
jgi:cephalosporin hydroxylase/methionyl-tRNA formyltransferase